MEGEVTYRVMANVIGLMILIFLVFLLLIVCIFLLLYSKSKKHMKKIIFEDFNSRLSHDIRTPMNVILGVAELSQYENNIDMLRKNVEDIKESGEYILSLIDDTLDYSCLESGKMKITRHFTNCYECISNIVKMVKPLADKKKVSIKTIGFTKEDSCRYIDETRVKQVFLNLLSNAVKFSPEKGTVFFTLEQTVDDGAVIHDRFQIRDSGIGMSKHFMKKHMFLPFEQEGNAFSSIHSGTGLGLSITKELIELMGGTIAVESVLGKGTTVTVDLPSKSFEKGETDKLIHEDGISDMKDKEYLIGKRILICEDQQKNSEITVRYLENVGCKVESVENGEKGVIKFAESEEGYYDAILMDIRMPIMNGLEATRAIRAMNRSDSELVPVIALTANAYDEDIKLSKEAGMNAHLTKPIATKILCETLINLISENSYNKK